MTRFFYIFIFVLVSSFYVFASDVDNKSAQDAFEYYSVGNYSEALPIFEELFESLVKDDPNNYSEQFKYAMFAGNSRRSLGDYKKGEEWYKIALDLAEKSDNSKFISLLYTYIAEAERYSDNFNESIEYYNKALNNDDLNDKDKAYLYYGLAESTMHSGEYDKALEFCAESDVITKKLKLEKLSLLCEIVRGECFRNNGDYSNALKSFNMALDTARARRYIDVSVSALSGLGLTSEALERMDAARTYFEEALNLVIRNELYDSIDLLVSKIISILPDNADFNKQALSNEKLGDDLSKSGDYGIFMWRLAAAYYKASLNYPKMYSSYEKIFKYCSDPALAQEKVSAEYQMAYALFLNTKYKDSAAMVSKTLETIKNVANSESTSEDIGYFANVLNDLRSLAADIYKADNSTLFPKELIIK